MFVLKVLLTIFCIMSINFAQKMKYQDFETAKELIHLLACLIIGAVVWGEISSILTLLF